MKRTFLTLGISMISLFLFLASCGKEEGTVVVVPDVVPDTTPIPDPMFGDITDPAWSVSTDYDYSTSMTAVVGVELQGSDSLWTIDTADRVAAFIGDECVGLANPTGMLFFLFVVPPRQSDTYGQVTLRYYSSYYHNIFRSDNLFPFVNGTQQGAAATPLQVVFQRSAR